jgi:3-phenylpropionate/cinnamic acid dioxygenase small subunit
MVQILQYQTQISHMSISPPFIKIPVLLMASVLFFAHCREENKNNKNHYMLSQQEISDRIQIEDLLVRYCYAVDDRNWDAYRHIFTSDAIIDDTKTGGIKSNVEDHITYMKKALSKILLSQHAISTCMIDLKGDSAVVRTHCSCPMKLDLGNGNTQLFFQGLWYYDQLVRTPDGWKISNRYEDGYWNHNVPKDFKF